MSRPTTAIARILLLVIAALLSSTLTSPAARAATPLALTDIYNNSSVLQISITLSDESVAAINADPKKYALGKVRFTVKGKDSGLLDVGVRLKGSTSLWGQTLANKPSLKLKFNYGQLSGNRFLGLKEMTLNAMSQDSSKIHEFGSYALFNAMNVPAPKTGWANVKVNGVTKGLYINLETMDDIFLSKRFKDPTVHLFEGVALNDFKPGKDDGGKNSGAFLVSEGWKTLANKSDLTRLINQLNVTSDSTWWVRLGTNFDRTRLINQFAVENFVGHWDSYSGPIVNNYFVRSNDRGVFTMMPWGTDQTFGENRQTTKLGDKFIFSMIDAQVGYPWVQQVNHVTKMSRGVLFSRCVGYTPCRTAYLKALKVVSAKATSMKLVDSMKAAVKLTTAYRAGASSVETANTYAFVASQQKAVTALLKQYKIS